MSENREIRFVDPQSDELFTIPDGGRIIVTRPMGEMYPGVQEQWVGECRFMDSCHVSVNGSVNGSCYHIDQFYDIQKRIGAKIEPETEPEVVSGYRVTARTFVGDKVFKLGHNPNAPEPYGTWMCFKSENDRNSFGHYWSDKSTARTDFFLRADAERTGRAYDHTALIKENKSRDDGAR
ncbi:MAG: hypothetical protein LBS74_08855 [Oscillospiraceae bacterium]|jgi:hypothetical protein|nr:hypothetical protein [Oscillospiraceae bacterium]